MEITVCYFGLLAETVQKEKEILHTQANTLGDLRLELSNRYPQLQKSTFVMAQNNEIKAEEEALIQGEVALFPPFSGG